ncbi:hypothetical protein L7F22_010254 [Adiantum nelumboides]|nr:hypothetical protein [Adiantum nelumboides]
MNGQTVFQSSPAAAQPQPRPMPPAAPLASPPPPPPAASPAPTFVKSQAQLMEESSTPTSTEGGAAITTAIATADAGRQTASVAANPKKLGVKYRECWKNHAVNIGRHTFDGCGELIPSKEEGSLKALTCRACGCHRNFHKREVEGSDLATAACR